MKTQNKSEAAPHPVYLKAARGEYVAAKDLAKLIRDALKRAFPDSKFSVTSSAGCVDVRWQDGPSGKQVSAIVDTFETRGFDGSIDLAHHNSLWIYPDGSAHIAHDHGTEGSMGTHPEVIQSAKRPDGVFLDNVASCFVSAQRTVTPRAFRRAIAEYRAQNWVGTESVDWDGIEIATSDYDGSGYLKNCPNIQPGNGYRWLSDEINSLAYSYDLTAPEPGCDIENCAQCARNAELAEPHTPTLCW